MYNVVLLLFWLILGDDIRVGLFMMESVQFVFSVFVCIGGFNRRCLQAKLAVFQISIFFCRHLQKVHILSKLFQNLFDCTHIFSCHYTLQYSEMQWQAGRLWQQFSRTYQASSNSLFSTKITLPDDYCASLKEQFPVKSILLKKYSTVVLLIHLPMLNISKPLKTNQN